MESNRVVLDNVDASYIHKYQGAKMALLNHRFPEIQNHCTLYFESNIRESVKRKSREKIGQKKN